MPYLSYNSLFILLINIYPLRHTLEILPQELPNPVLCHMKHQLQKGPCPPLNTKYHYNNKKQKNNYNRLY